MKLKESNVRILITIPIKLKQMIHEYNEEHWLEKLHVNEICAKAIYETIKKSDCEELENPKELNDELKPIIPCPICGKDFVQTKPNRLYCSKTCGTQASRLRNK